MEPIHDKASHYLTKDLIENFQIRVSLELLSSSQVIGTKEKNPIKTATFHEERVIRWQEKILRKIHGSYTYMSAVRQKCKISSKYLKCHDEKEEYQRSKYKNHPTYGHYHMLATSSTPSENRIFTYTSTDTYTSTKHSTTTTKTKANDEISLKNRFKRPTAPKNVLQTGLKKEDIRFFIMASLKDRSDVDNPECDVILCKIKYNSQGELVIHPPLLTDTDKPYRIEGLSGTRIVYEYVIQDASPAPPARISSFRMNSFDYATDPEFSCPDTGETHYHWTGEIVRCLNFNDTSGAIYVHYIMSLPTGWKSISNTELEGCSTASFGTFLEGREICHFSNPLIFSVSRSKEAIGWPTLLFAVFSTEWLGYDRDQGYAAMKLPLSGLSNHRNISIHTWRPTPRTMQEYLTRYFLGGATLLKNSSYLDSQCNKKTVSRFGLETESSGTIELRIDCMIQQNISDHCVSELRENMTSTVLRPSTLAVIEAFQKSFIKAREARLKSKRK